jgi:uncharacterized DUF497 family protein
MIDWSDEKNELLKSTRGVSFEEVATELESGRFVIDERGDWFLKSIIPSRKAKKAGKI